jgi:hypothetical protein
MRAFSALCIPSWRWAVVLFILSISLLFFSSITYAAEDSIGQVIWVKGSIKAIGESKVARTLQRRSPLYLHDIINTEAGSMGGITFTDGAAITLNQNTSFKIDDYHFKKGGSPDNKSVMSVIKGGLRTITGAIPKENPDAYQMKTPVATIGVRGTDYTLSFNPLKGGLYIKIDKGSIAVTNKKGTLVLDKAKGPLFGQVADENSAPTELSEEPAELKDQLPISTNGLPSSLSGKRGGRGGSGSGTVSSFCIH